jgi:hypothetical protein
MTFPHPKSREGNYGKGDIPNKRGVVGEFYERTPSLTVVLQFAYLFAAQ